MYYPDDPMFRGIYTNNPHTLIRSVADVVVAIGMVAMPIQTVLVVTVGIPYPVVYAIYDFCNPLGSAYMDEWQLF